MHVAVAVGRPGAFGERGGVPGEVRGELVGQGRVGGVAAEPAQVAFEQAGHVRGVVRQRVANLAVDVAVGVGGDGVQALEHRAELPVDLVTLSAGQLGAEIR